MVEAKRFGQSAFQVEQLAKELALTIQQAGDRTPLLLLVLPDAPPVPVRSHGRMAVEDAITLGVEAIRQRFDLELDAVDTPRIADTVAVLTWDDLAFAINDALALLGAMDPSILASLERVVNTASAAIRWHASKDGGAA
jgi:hypothetical protein